MTDGTSHGDHRLDALLSPKQLGQFISVGAAGFVVDLTTLIVLREVLGVPAYIAGLASIEAAILVMFVINEHWTFAEVGTDSRRSLLGRAIRSHAVRAAGSTTQYLIFVGIYYYLFTELRIAGIDGWLVVAKVVGISIAMVVNYTFETLYTWRVHVDEG